MKELLNKNEVFIIQMALTSTIQDLEAVSKDVRYPFDPAARKDMTDMLTTAKSAQEKIRSLSGIDGSLGVYIEGDENAMFTKES